MYLLIVGPGGNGQTYFMDFCIHNGYGTNCYHDFDGFKHAPKPHMLREVDVSKCIFLYNDPYKTIRSHYRRDVQYGNWVYKQICKLGNPHKLSLEDVSTFEQYKALVKQRKLELFGIEHQFEQWLHPLHPPKFPIYFLDFNDILEKKAEIDAFLGRPLDYSKFESQPRKPYKESDNEISERYSNLYTSFQTRATIHNTKMLEEYHARMGFILLRHVNSIEADHYWRDAYQCIRVHYPYNKIVIIDSQSNEKYLTQIPMVNTEIIVSEYSGRGEFLPYYYYLKHKWFPTAVFIHDTVYIHKFIDFGTSTYQILWGFQGYTLRERKEEAVAMIQSLQNNDELLHFYLDESNEWSGCFGSMTCIHLPFLEALDAKYDFSQLLNTIRVKRDREAFERVFACLLQKESPATYVLSNDIFQYQPYGLLFQQRNDYGHLPAIKVWGSRLRIAILLIGDVRDCETKKKLKSYFAHFPVFHATYTKHREFVETIGNCVYSVLSDPETDIRPPAVLEKQDMQQNMLQWMHLDNLLRTYKDELQTYDVIVKLRYDTRIRNMEFLQHMNVAPNTIYNQSDMMFYANAKTFFHIFEGWYDTISETYDYKAHRTNPCGETSWRSEPQFRAHLERKSVQSQYMEMVDIDRGTFVKTVGDGIASLYDNDTLRGKFS